MHRGLSRALKMPQWGIFFGRDIPWAYGLAVTASACAPWAGLVLCDRCACSGSLLPPQQAVLVPHGAQTAVPSKTSNKKYPAASCEVFCGAPSGTRTQDPLIKSQLLSLVARTHGALSSIHNCSSIGFLNSTIHPIT